ncbi:MAG: calcium-binding protein [Brevirhabdus sp.]
MVEITGTPLVDRLRGTSGDDTLIPLGTEAVGIWDRLAGRAGNDTYDLGGFGRGVELAYIIHDTSGADQIIGAGSMYQSASLGYSAWAEVTRAGDDLVIHLPGKPHRFRDPARPDYDIRIKDHFSGAAVESLTAGGVTYALAAGTTGSAVADIVAGGKAGETLIAFGGDDFVFGNGGRDLLDLGAGNDTAFGGTGADTVMGGSGDDLIYGGDRGDRLYGETGNDQIRGEGGSDRIWGGDGADWLLGGTGNDVIFGGTGNDILAGGAGDDRLRGQQGADTYQIEVYGTGSGDDMIRDGGDAGNWSQHDVINLRGVYGPAGGSTGETYAMLGFARVGDDMVMSIDGGALGTVTVDNMFDAGRHGRFFIEELLIDGAYWESIHFQFLDGQVHDIGDDRSYALGYGADLNEVIFGTDADDLIFGGTGTNFIWTGDGVDTLIYKVGDGESLGAWGGAISRDIVEDFDVTMDVLDFSEVTNDIGTPRLEFSEDADGDLMIFINTGNWEVASISIELRGVSLDQAGDLNLIF